MNEEREQRDRGYSWFMVEPAYNKGTAGSGLPDNDGACFICNIVLLALLSPTKLCLWTLTTILHHPHQNHLTDQEDH